MTGSTRFSFAVKSSDSRSKVGSALLIVLGMFAFMLVSAVSFSVYMRSSRAPSSFLRRNTATRHLVKAALARAIDEIDTAIGNDPFPGVGFNHDYGSSGTGQGDRAKNDNWHGRVFAPSNEVALAETVSTLTLEGLGYVPSCIANEVRYWSRHTRTAKWHPFNFGMGRYAFTAINVSDFYDLNEFVTPAGGVRPQYLNRSSAPQGRISPSYLFRSGENSDMDNGGAAASMFLSAMASGAGVGGGNAPSVADVPFTSFMDFNLAMLNAGNALGGLASPYVNLIRNNNSSTYYSGAVEAARRSLFMAGGWNSDSNLTYSAYKAGYPERINLRYPEMQPFYGCDWVWNSGTLTKCLGAQNDFWNMNQINSRFPILSTALLCDYLDEDSVPLSLCIPCVENVPMLCGMELNDCVKYKVLCVEETISEANAETGAKKKIKVTYSFRVEVQNPVVTLTAAYPFVNGPQGGASGFTAEAFIRVFFVEEPTGNGLNDTGLRTSLSNLGWMEPNGGTPGDAIWSHSDSAGAICIQVSCGKTGISTPTVSGTGESAEESAIVKDIALMGSSSAPKEAMLAELVYEVDENGQRTLVEGECKNGDAIAFYDSGWKAVGSFLDELKGDLNPGRKFRPSAAVWARVKDSSGKTVDMAPAVPEYDVLSGHADNVGVAMFNEAAGGAAGIPLMRFFPKVDDAAAGVVLTKKYFEDNKDAERTATWKQKSYMASDPRMNWAPEQWWATDQTGNPKDLWFNAVKNLRQGDTLRDQDIFMSVSDQGYLQSMYEWMMIPQVRGMDGSGGNVWGVFEGGGEYNGTVRTAIGDVAYNNVMWRTYRSDAFGPDNSWGSIDDIAFDDAENGIRINPYTDMIEVMLGAFANMPYDWWSAGTNHNANGKSYMNASAPSFEKNYLFNWSCNYNDVYNMAYYWMGAFNYLNLLPDERQKKLYLADGWKDVIEDAVNWRTGALNCRFTETFDDDTTLNKAALSGNNATVESILQSLTFAERKFLYGYLKGCFANRSQLFLVFVRAEPSSVGAAGAGGRAVALVWRDPAAPTDNNGQFKKSSGGSEQPEYGKDNGAIYLNPLSSSQPEEAWRLRSRNYPPHRTRILFYHQLD